MYKQPVLCIVGPTASGKTGLSLTVAMALDGEIMNMDSMQIYRRMNIGTAKPTLEERKGIPHHLLDIVEPSETFTVAQYAKAADVAITDVAARGKLPILVGGTGFYLRALTHGLSLGGVKSDATLRERLKTEADSPDGKRRLHERLKSIDPATAARLHCNDVQRVTRAIEVFELTGKPISMQEQAPIEAPYDFCLLGTTMERKALYERINARVEKMMEQGLFYEVQALLDSGVPAKAQAMQGIGYKELAAVLAGEITIVDAVGLIQQHSRHYAKRQWTWFRSESTIRWLDMADDASIKQALQIAEVFWKEANA